MLLAIVFLLFSSSLANKQAAGSGFVLSLSLVSPPWICNEEGGGRVGGGGSYASTFKPSPWRGSALAALAPLSLLLSCFNKSVRGACASSYSLPFEIGDDHGHAVCHRSVSLVVDAGSEDTEESGPISDAFGCLARMDLVHMQTCCNFSSSIVMQAAYLYMQIGVVCSALRFFTRSDDISLRWRAAVPRVHDWDKLLQENLTAHMLHPQQICEEVSSPTMISCSGSVCPKCVTAVSGSNCYMTSMHINGSAKDAILDVEQQSVAPTLMHVFILSCVAIMVMVWRLGSIHLKVSIADVHNMEMSIFSCWCPSAVGLVSIKGFLCLHRFTWCCYASLYVDEKEQNCYSLCCVLNANGFEDAMLENVRTFPFGLFHRWRVRAPLLLVLRFNGKGVVMLSSVKLTRNLQLGSFQPQVHMPIRSPGEPLGYYW